MSEASTLFRRQLIPPPPPGLYPGERTIGGVRGYDAVGEAALARFEEDGCLVVHDAFTPAEVAGVVDGLLDLISGSNPEFKGPE
ncbi:MAG: hypothetical protein HYU66_27610, partial [Armatimonadetes bacterium]|nr:hypothetical protein [Armatimonadota bacterium]